MKRCVLCLGLLMVLVISGCGSNGSGGSTITEQQGVFVDSPVEGMGYRTGTHFGMTDSEGTFTFFQGETITFFIGDVVIGEATVKPLMTPLDLVEEANDENHQAVVNIARLLQSLDTDGDLSNGIQISKAVSDTLKNEPPIDYNQAEEEFANDLAVKGVFEKLNTAKVFTDGERTLCEAAAAKEHFQKTLKENPVITVRSPNGKEFEVANRSLDITWQACSSIENVKILLSQDGGETWDEKTPIAASTPNDGRYTWDSVPIQVNNTRNRIRIVDAANPDSYDDSNMNFTILFPNDEITRVIQESQGNDRDGDRLPDDLEEALGTNPDHRDSDRDGFDDYHEILDGQSFGDYFLGPDVDNDGIIAALDTDDDGDGVHDGAGIDSDGDGIANYLEVNGYTHNWYSDNYALWDGVSFDEPYFKTDPRQISTDQDPYSDSMEASGELIDVLIGNPGDLPMVPAYPNIVVRLEGYQVTLNGEITISEGGSLAKESTWNRETGTEHSQQWEVSGSHTSTVKIGGQDKLAYEGSITIGGGYADTNTSSSSSSIGGSITTDQNWQKATSSNPAEAARIKLNLKVYNYGTAAASNVSPTLTLKIGGMNVLTFKPEEPINILQPGGVYPSQEGLYWVVDKTSSAEPHIYLTLEELRALETGAPISISVTQMQSDVMLQNAAGQWETAGEWGQYMARCEAVSANILLDAGNGHFIHHLVYADDSATAPQVTFGDVLHWVAGVHTLDGQPHIAYYDPFDMEDIVTPMGGYSFMVDNATLAANGWVVSEDQLTHPNVDTFDINDIVLGPQSVVVGKTSPEVLNETGPTIHYAYYDQKLDRVAVLVSDYIGVDNVIFSIADGPDDDALMEENLRGSGYYQLDGIQWPSIDGPIDCCYASCTAVATNAHGETVEAAVVCLEYADQPEEPVKPEITGVSMNRAQDPLVDPSVYINVEVTESPDWPVTSVWLYNPDNSTVPIKLAEDLDYWSGTSGHWFTKTDKITYEALEGTTIVAEIDPAICPLTDPNCFDTLVVRSRDMAAVSSGSGQLINRIEHWGFNYLAFYSFMDFYKPILLGENSFDHKGTAKTGWWDDDSTDNAISAYPNAEIFMAGHGDCGSLFNSVSITEFLVNSGWTDLNFGSARTGTEAQRMTYYDSFDSASISDQVALGLNRLPFSDTGAFYFPVDQGGCEDYREGQYRIVLFDIGDGYVVKFMFYDYNLGHTDNYTNSVNYMYEVYFVGP